MHGFEAIAVAARGRTGSAAPADLLCWAFADQEERTKAIEAFRDGKKDVLVATDVASKGLDFPAIQHVINYDMPEEIENYGGDWAPWGTDEGMLGCVQGPARLCACLCSGWGRRWSVTLHSPRPDPVSFSTVHRIGRTGRSGNTGIATTFINKACGENQCGSGGCWLGGCSCRRQLGDKAASALARGIFPNKQGRVTMAHGGEMVVWGGGPHPCSGCV